MLRPMPHLLKEGQLIVPNTSKNRASFIISMFALKREEIIIKGLLKCHLTFSEFPIFYLWTSSQNRFTGSLSTGWWPEVPGTANSCYSQVNTYNWESIELASSIEISTTMMDLAVCLTFRLSFSHLNNMFTLNSNLTGLIDLFLALINLISKPSPFFMWLSLLNGKLLEMNQFELILLISRVLTKPTTTSPWIVTYSSPMHLQLFQQSINL